MAEFAPHLPDPSVEQEHSLVDTSGEFTPLQQNVAEAEADVDAADALAAINKALSQGVKASEILEMYGDPEELEGIIGPKKLKELQDRAEQEKGGK